MKKLLFLLLLFPFFGNSQATFTAPVGYNTGVPSATPSGVGTRWRFDLLTGKKYTWLPGSLSWDEDARGIDQVAGCSAPLYTPGYNQSTFAVNSCSPPILYQWTGAAWEIPNEPEVYTAGTGIAISGGNEISNTAPNIVQTLSIAGQDLTLSGGGGTVEIPAGGNGIYGGSGTVADGTIATLGLNRLTFSSGAGDYSDFIGFTQDDDNFIGAAFNGGSDDEFSFVASLFSPDFLSQSQYRIDYNGTQIAASNPAGSSIFSYQPNGLFISTTNGLGAQYAADYSATIATNPRSIPDVGTVDLLKQTPVSYTNAAAPNNCIFYSTTLSKLAYKDPGGTVNPLY